MKSLVLQSCSVSLCKIFKFATSPLSAVIVCLNIVVSFEKNNSVQNSNAILDTRNDYSGMSLKCMYSNCTEKEFHSSQYCPLPLS